MLNPEANFEATQRRRKEKSSTFFKTSMRKHLFSKAIIETSLLDNLKNPTKDRYDRSEDPNEHITIYTTHISLYTWNDVILCRVFPTTLKEATLRLQP